MLNKKLIERKKLEKTKLEITSIASTLQALYSSFLLQCGEAITELSGLLSDCGDLSTSELIYPDKKCDGFCRVLIWSKDKTVIPRRVIEVRFGINSQIGIKYWLFENNFQRANNDSYTEIDIEGMDLINLFDRVDDLKQFLLTGIITGDYLKFSDYREKLNV